MKMFIFITTINYSRLMKEIIDYLKNEGKWPRNVESDFKKIANPGQQIKERKSTFVHYRLKNNLKKAE